MGFGNYRTRTFTEIFNDGKSDITANNFLEYYNNIEIPKTISEASVKTLFYLLYANYGNSHIASSDENQFIYKLFTIIFQYGPAWEKRLEIQSNLRNLTDDDLATGTKMIFNHSFNPSSAPSTSSLEELTTINDQNTNNVKRGKLESYQALWDMIATDVTKEFIDRFKRLFLTIVEPQEPLWYVSED